MVLGLLARKLGMSQLFTEDGVRIPVTVLEVGPCSVQAVREKEKDGYSAVQLGFGDKKDKHVKKPQMGDLKKKNLKAKKFVREVFCDGKTDVKVGDEITLSMFQVGDFLDAKGISKGKGFQGGMRRHNWNGGGATHGSMSHRAPGSIGSSSFPSRVFKGMRMAGHMGARTVTTQNLEIVDIDTSNSIISIKGAVPGANGSYLVIRYAKKKAIASRKKNEKEEAVK